MRNLEKHIMRNTKMRKCGNRRKDTGTGALFLITEALGEIERMRAEVFKLQGATECPKCGAKMPQGAAFCSNCGTKMDDMFEE